MFTAEFKEIYYKLYQNDPPLNIIGGDLKSIMNNLQFYLSIRTQKSIFKNTVNGNSFTICQKSN